MASLLASEVYSNSRVTFTYANDVIIVSQTAFIWDILCLRPYLN